MIYQPTEIITEDVEPNSYQQNAILDLIRLVRQYKDASQFKKDAKNVMDIKRSYILNSEMSYFRYNYRPYFNMVNFDFLIGLTNTIAIYLQDNNKPENYIVAKCLHESDNSLLISFFKESRFEFYKNQFYVGAYTAHDESHNNTGYYLIFNNDTEYMQLIVNLWNILKRTFSNFYLYNNSLHEGFAKEESHCIISSLLYINEKLDKVLKYKDEAYIAFGCMSVDHKPYNKIAYICADINDDKISSLKNNYKTLSSNYRKTIQYPKYYGLKTVSM